MNDLALYKSLRFRRHLHSENNVMFSNGKRALKAAPIHKFTKEIHQKVGKIERKKRGTVFFRIRGRKMRSYNKSYYNFNSKSKSNSNSNPNPNYNPNYNYNYNYKTVKL